MEAELGDTDSAPNLSEKSYKIINHPGSQLPSEFTNLILSPFLYSLRDHNDWFKLIEKDTYYDAYKPYVRLLMNRTNSMIRLAILSDKTVLGWCLSELDTLHFIWVKKEVRRQGIGKALLPKNIKKFSHITTFGLSIWPKLPGVKFDPFV